MLPDICQSKFLFMNGGDAPGYILVCSQTSAGLPSLRAALRISSHSTDTAVPRKAPAGRTTTSSWIDAGTLLAITRAALPTMVAGVPSLPSSSQTVARSSSMLAAKAGTPALRSSLIRTLSAMLSLLIMPALVITVAGKPGADLPFLIDLASR